MPALPNKLFDVRNGNNAVDSDATVYPRATIIVFKDNAAKQTVMDAFALLGNYSATLPDGSPNPQSDQQFFNKELQQFIKERVRQA